MSNNIIHDVFDEAQKSQKMHNIGCQKLYKLLNSDRARDAFMVICQCYDKVLSCSKKEAAAELTVKFFVTLVANTSNTSEDVFLSFVKYLLERSSSLDKVVRFRSCQTISCIFKEFPEGSEISDTLWETMSEKLLPRLKDKDPNVRMWSVKALKDLQDPQNPDDPILNEFIRLMGSDSSKDVRIAAIDCITISKISLVYIIDRLCDVKTEVRLCATQKLFDHVDVANLTQKQRGLVVKFALNDREESVREKVLDLMVKWLYSKAIDEDVPKLLYFIGLVSNSAETELLAWSLIEAGVANKQFNIVANQEQKTVSLKMAVEGNSMNWQRSFKAIPPSELLWTLLRCDFYFKSLSSENYSERVEHFLPDTVILCDLLREGHILMRDENCPQTYELSMDLLLRITGFVDTSDFAGSKALISTCKEMVGDLKFLETLVEPVLTACCKAMTSVGDNVVEDMTELSLEIWPSVFDSEASDEDPFKPKNPNVDLAQLRSLQVAAWTIQNMTASKRRHGGSDSSPVEALVPIVLQSLQQPIKELRSAALRCLGLLGISSEKHCEAFAGIVLQVASANQEDAFIRCQAIESLTDMSMVHSDSLISQDTLVTLLTRMIDCGMPLIQRIAAEASVKLLFSGRIVKSPVLFARLVRIFFNPIESSDTDSEFYLAFSNPQIKSTNEACKGSEAYLDQLLSIFFPAFFSAGGNRSEIIIDSIMCLISNCVMCVRDGFAETISMQKMMEHLLSWCDFLPKSDGIDEIVSLSNNARKEIKIRLGAICFKEMLLSDSKLPSSKQLMKDLTKLLTLLAPCDWIKDTTMGKTILKICRFIKNQCLLDKVSSKHLSTLYTSCQDFMKHVENKNESATENSQNNISDFFSYAPGLLERLSDWSDDVDVAVLETESDDEEFSSTVFVPARARIARASKIQASSRIAEQLAEENIQILNGNMEVLSISVTSKSSLSEEGNSSCLESL